MTLKSSDIAGSVVDQTPDTASSVPFTPGQDVMSSTVQEAILENDAEITLLEQELEALGSIDWSARFQNSLL